MIKGRVDTLPLVMYHEDMDKEKFVKWLTNQIEGIENMAGPGQDSYNRVLLISLKAIMSNIEIGLFDACDHEH